MTREEQLTAGSREARRAALLAEIEAHEARRPRSGVKDVTPPGWQLPEPERVARDQNHRVDVLVHHTHSAGRASGAAEVVLPPQPVPPTTGAGWRSLDDPRGFVEAPVVRSVVKDVTPAEGARSPLDGRFKELEREVASLRRQIIAGAGSVAVEPVVAKAVEPAPAGGLTIEQWKQQWDRDRWASAKASKGNEDGSGWVRVQGYGVEGVE